MQVRTLSKRTIIKNVGIFLLCGAAGWYLKGRLTPSASPMAGMGGGTPYVLVESLEQRNIAPKKSYIGHVEAIKSVDLKPQISGYVEKVLFEEGSLVNEGDILFVIEQKRYIATVELRQAELASAKANLVKTKRDYDRQKSLSKQNITSKATYDTAESAYLQAQAAVKQAEASLELAKIDLDYTEIKAPITGYIGKAAVTEGNYVNSSSQNLARIVQVNPIRVAFSVTDKDMLDAKKLFRTGNQEKLKTEIILPNGEVLVNHLISRFADNEVNSDTATITIYMEYQNQNNLLIPGNYVDILVGTSADKPAILVSQAAIAQDENGNYVVVVNQDGIAEQKRVALGEIVGDKQVVLEGLSAEDKVIIQGLQKVRNGQKVNASEVPATKAEVK